MSRGTKKKVGGHKAACHGRCSPAGVKNRVGAASTHKEGKRGANKRNRIGEARESPGRALAAWLEPSWGG